VVAAQATAVAEGAALVVGRDGVVACGGVAATCVVRARRRLMLGRRGGPVVDDRLGDLRWGLCVDLAREALERGATARRTA
jgi:hypothetical protein